MKFKDQTPENRTRPRSLIEELMFEVARRGLKLRHVAQIIGVTSGSVTEWAKGGRMNRSSEIAVRVGLQKIRRLPVSPAYSIFEDRKLFIRLKAAGLTFEDKRYLLDAADPGEYHDRLSELAARYNVGVEGKHEDATV